MSASILVAEPGLQTTVQDLGRLGVQGLGVPVSGVLDPEAMRLANALVGNAADAAVLEIRLTGFAFRAEGGPVRFAVAGASARIDPPAAPGAEPRTVRPWCAAVAPEGSLVTVAPPQGRTTATLALAGGIAAPLLWGSRATYVRGGFGGHEGRALRRGDRLALGPAAEAAPLAMRPPPDTAPEIVLRVTLGPQADHFTADAVATFLAARYAVTREADRMGMRLEGPRLAHANGHDIVSDAVLPGSVQVPGTGQPILLLADCQTTGGYPKIATVISADMPLAGRIGPGAAVRFRAVAVAEAETLARQAHRALAEAIAALAPAAGPGAIDSALLRRENLISGVVGPIDWSTEP